MKRIISNALGILTRRERTKLFRFVLLNIGVSLIDILSLTLLVMFINDYTQKSGNALNDPLPPIAVIFTLFVLKSVVGYQTYVNQYRYVYDVASRISRRNLLQYLEGSYTEYVSVDSSVQIRKILHQPIEFCHYVLTGILRGAAESVLALMTVAALLLFNVKLFLLLTLVLVPPVCVLSYFTKRRLRHARANAKTSGERSLQYLQESLSGYVEGNVFDRKDFFADRYSKYQKEMVRFLADVETAQGLPSRLIEVFAVAGILVIVLWSRLPANAVGLSMVNIGAFMAAAYKIIPGIVKMSNLASQVKTYEYTVNDLLQLNSMRFTQANTEASCLQNLTFQNVHFSHCEQTILNNCNLEISKGDFIGIHGPSGKGKTTILNLLLGFLSPHQGEILVNGAVASAKERRAFWRQISYVQQRPFLLHDTIHANITLAEETNEAVSLDELMEIVGLSELAKRSVNGENVIVTENGKNISGGQRQRIAIARALYKQSGLIILDEPFSELDTASEKRILAHLKTLSENGTMIIMVTHKQENLSYCNKVYEVS